MKKVKLMLLSFCVFAIVAGVLAFKAKGALNFCWAPVNTGFPFCGTTLFPKACPSYTILGNTSQTKHICTAPSTGISGNECTNVKCNTTSVLSTTTE